MRRPTFLLRIPQDFQGFVGVLLKNRLEQRRLWGLDHFTEAAGADLLGYLVVMNEIVLQYIDDREKDIKFVGARLDSEFVQIGEGVGYNLLEGGVP